jgi:hypothetical protein
VALGLLLLVLLLLPFTVLMSLAVLQLPDGTEIQVGPDRFKVPEVLFNPVSLAVILMPLN